MKGVVALWEKQYNQCVPDLCGRNKVYPLGDKNGGPVVTGTGPLVKAMVNIEKLDPNQLKKADQTPKAYKAYTEGVKEFEKAFDAYEKIVKQAVGKVDKKEHPEAYRSLKVLSTALNAIEARVANHYTVAVSKKKELEKINAEALKKIEKANKKGDDKAAAEERELSGLKKMLVMLATQGKSATAKALAAIQEIKKDPTATTYNLKMNDAGRDLSQWLVNIDKLKKHATFGKMKNVTALADPSGYTKLAAEYGNGAKRKIPDTTDTPGVLKLLKDFSGLTKSVATDFKDIINKKVV